VAIATEAIPQSPWTVATSPQRVEHRGPKWIPNEPCQVRRDLGGLVPIGPENTEIARVVMLVESKGCDNLGSGTVATVEGIEIYVEDPVFGMKSSQLDK
jgi:hypothetical protein